ncbi:GlxA family transcriptional regulator [Mesorhizobium sp. B4-1-4]|uniref:GlxA family transcriptional regulator n=1 Tax=Mesorhizobium sp. B4-1-4 TaxID=2589888 RepID=UPI001D035310|nr:GlxA family transcriptional regulator [Mesorhizobium sp. B4-1-4]UCI31867.1 GlxA family transcriptional regulator [Mesorhizobium sp. B4-1-4]
MHDKRGSVAPRPGHVEATAKTTSYVFYLTEDFPLIAFSSAIEVLRLANTVLGYGAYEWRLASRGGTSVRSSSGVPVSVVSDLASERRNIISSERPKMVILCAGRTLEGSSDRALQAWLRECRLRRVAVGALGSGSYMLATAGLLEKRRCAIHWEKLPGFSERFSTTSPSHTIFQEDGDIWTCPGGMAALHMMLQIVGADFGKDIVTRVCDHALVDRVRESTERQRVPLASRPGKVNETIITLVEQMEMNLAEPLQIDDLALQVRLSRRQVERLFRSHLGCSPVRYYLKLRLERAKLLITQSTIPIIDIAMSCGFVSASHFSKCYRDANGMSPQQARRGRNYVLKRDRPGGSAA